MFTFGMAPLDGNSDHQDSYICRIPITSTIKNSTVTLGELTAARAAASRKIPLLHGGGRIQSLLRPASQTTPWHRPSSDQPLQAAAVDRDFCEGVGKRSETCICFYLCIYIYFIYIYIYMYRIFLLPL